ncbi:DUF4105 domain-containing protein [Pseudoxanthomonas winnipegensis]|jgi:hypothetical protein|uniref:DUF4105 domain-containing protein n=1 Tax=Pseudoxanthomonas winnipegensis TaxID=2480810 RepID=A0ABY1WHT2_9GAMM|nr:DUF4105 domain-containing protein [Pseudoxanthomonas winnipegensis]TAA10605.1 DUF4105 domain-containing protein [Pseudoxanthomonas winnipegensis]TAA22238.1 DUF4105 domain-containing protein [Pseudoxanthomonas winnipegensis]TAH74590.1 DUF4105 domain-containing protein [Pseudoxanthomonas winnipegensis]
MHSDSYSPAPVSGRWRRALTWCLLPPLLAWAVLASIYLDHWPHVLRGVLALTWLWLGWRVLRARHRAGGARWAGAALLVWLGFLAGWSLQAPRQDRLWADDVARLLQAQVQGDTVVLENVRDFRWRSDTDYDVRWETRRYDLSQLRSADLALSYWMGPAIAHTLVSFGFADGRHLVFSLEIRKERGEAFSALGGFFRQYEETLVAAEEDDILRVRTNVRGEDMWLYRLNLPPAALRQLFMAYLDKAGALRARPAFYNTVMSNCTTVIFQLARRIDARLPLDWRLLLSGYFDRYVADHGGLMPGIDFATLRARGHITTKARAVGEGEDFSRAIRVGVPGEVGP